LIRLTPEAEAQVDSLINYYESRDRTEASRNLRVALISASDRILQAPLKGLPAPRHYPSVVMPGHLWLKAGNYWIAYRPAPEPTIVGVFYESANIPGRL
jgi:plasmid stabilization system protein ParE